MGKSKKAKEDKQQVIHFRHADDKRTNIPSAVIAGQGAVPKAEKKRYYYNPHLSPVLRFDSTGKADRIEALLQKARTEPIAVEEHRVLTEALRNHQPWLEWTGKREAEEKGISDPHTGGQYTVKQIAEFVRVLGVPERMRT